MSKYLSVCVNPTLQKTLVLPNLVEGEVNRSREYFLDSSGKGVNVARVLTHLGEHVVHLTHLGGRNVDLFLNLAEADGIGIRWVDSGSEIRFCHTLLNSAANTTTEIVEEALPVAPGTEERLLALYEEILSQVDIVTISGSKAGGYSDRLFPTMVRMAKHAAKFVILDYRGTDLLESLEHGPDVVKPNLAEFAQTFLKESASVADIGEQSEEPQLVDLVRRKMEEVRHRYGCRIVLTRGARPILFTADGGSIESYTPPAITPVNTIGSGDAFTAGLAARLSADADLARAVEHGAWCAGANAQHLRPGVLR